MPSIQEECAQRNVDPRISDLLEEFALTHTVVRCITEVDGFRFSVEPGANAAVYPSPRWMDIALDPDKAKSAANQHAGLVVTKTNPSTAYLRVSAEFLDTAGGRQVALGLLDQAWDKAFHGGRWEIGISSGGSAATGPMCEEHGIARSVSGNCELCDD